MYLVERRYEWNGIVRTKHKKVMKNLQYLLYWRDVRKVCAHYEKNVNNYREPFWKLPEDFLNIFLKKGKSGLQTGGWVCYTGWRS